MKNLKERIKMAGAIVALIAGLATPIIIGTLWVADVDRSLWSVDANGNRVNRIDNIETELVAINEKLEVIDQRFEAIDQRFEAIDQRFEAIDQRFDRLEAIIKDLPKLINVAAKNKSPS